MSDEVREPAVKYNFISAAEYLLGERAAEQKHEYYDGQVLAMGGASLRHNDITLNLMTNIGNFLKGKDCKILAADMRISTATKDA